MAQRRWQDNPGTELAAAKRNLSLVGSGWNKVPVRYGDHLVGGGADPAFEQDRTHGNTYTPQSCIKQACKEIGGDRHLKHEQGIQDHRHKLDMLMNCTAVAKHLHRDAAKKLYQESGDSHGVVMQRAFDSTPMLLRFGNMGQETMTTARYLKQVEPTVEKPYQRWKLISYDEWRRDNPRARMPTMGVLELLVMNGDVVQPTFEDPVHWQKTFQARGQPFILPLSVIESNNASCTYSAIEEAFGSWNAEGLEALSKLLLRDAESIDGAEYYSNGSLIIVDDVADMSRANGLFRKKMRDQFKALPNILYFANSYCAAHIIHRLITGMFGEEQVVGHVHACQHVLSITGRRELLLKALWTIIDRELIVHRSSPPKSCTDLVSNVIQETLERRIKNVNARSGQDLDSAFDDESASPLTAALPGLRKMCNGDIRRACCEHYCTSCCEDAEGNYSRAACVDNFFAAVVAAGLFGGLTNIVPAKSRWLSTSYCLATLVAAMAFHKLLIRAWELAFRDWHLEAPGDVDVDDFHEVTRSKAYRSKLWLTHDGTLIKSFVHVVCSAPAEHLLQRLQHLDAVRSGFDTLGASDGPFGECMASYLQMIVNPLGNTGMTTLIPLVAPGGVRDIRSICTMAFTYALVMGGRIWRDLFCSFTGWPYRLKDLGSIDQDKRADCAAELYAAKDCCTDNAVTGKMKRWRRSARTLLRCGRTMATWRVWRKRARFTNMHSERLFAKCRKASPLKSYVARQISAGWWSMLQLAHLEAGGEDCRKILRSQLRRDGIPIRAGRASQKRKHPEGLEPRAPKRQRSKNDWTEWFNGRIKEWKISLGLGPSDRAPRQEYVAQAAALREEWASGDPRAPQVPPRHVEDELSGMTYEDRIGETLWRTSSPGFPVCPLYFMRPYATCLKAIIGTVGKVLRTRLLLLAA